MGKWDLLKVFFGCTTRNYAFNIRHFDRAV